MTIQTTQTTQANPPTYREKQHQRYQQALALGHQAQAEEAIWRAASEGNLLQPGEERGRDRLTVPRILQLLTALGWER
jgi:hypothetical protein